MSMTNICKPALSVLLLLGTAACASLGATGPSTGAVRDIEGQSYADAGIAVIELNAGVTQRLTEYSAATSFAEVFDDAGVSPTLVGPGDTLDIAIWEAPPAVLFGTAPAELSRSGGLDTASTAEIPQQQVGEDGKVMVPFVGRIEVVGLRPDEIERVITSRLRGRANNPQAVVRLAQNESRTATILGNVASSQRMMLTGRGERILDALASAGGTREAIEQSTVQLARGNTRATMPVGQVIADPAQNVRLRPGDVITVQHQPFSFVALGAVTRSAEVPFEGGGVNLAQALGRVGGLAERRADIKGVFVFRMEPRSAVESLLGPDARTTADGRVPVVYSLRMDDASSLFAMQDFQMRDDDVLYISTAPGVELERFLATLSTTAFSIIATANALDNQ
ncbi:MAG: capsular biosynthesis protein [Erythrobacteraceae bacterium]|nr:capsular biosynthesis protein [Erythrobacteraceae bacterium]